MLKRWIYGLLLLVLFGVGLALGAANDAVVTFDFLVVKMDVTLGTVLTCGVVFGLVLGLYISLFLCFKYWRQARTAKSELKRTVKELENTQASTQN